MVHYGKATPIRCPPFRRTCSDSHLRIVVRVGKGSSQPGRLSWYRSGPRVDQAHRTTPALLEIRLWFFSYHAYY